jgi:hypothetical protein
LSAGILDGEAFLHLVNDPGRRESGGACLVEQTEARKETEAREHDGQYQKQSANHPQYGKGFPSVEFHLAIVP